MDNHFDSNGGPQNEHPIGQQNNYGVPYAAYGELAGQLAVTDSALASFFKIMEEQQVPRSDLDSKLREIAGQYKELLHHWETVQSADPQVRALKEQAIAAGAYADNRAMKGATLNNISQIYHARGDYAAALKYLEQSLAITQEIGDKRGEGVILNNIGRLYKKPDDYDTALKYLEQSLAIMQEIDNKRGEAEISWNIGLAYIKKGTLNKAEAYISRAVQLAEEIGLPELEQFCDGLARLRTQLKGR